MNCGSGDEVSTRGNFESSGSFGDSYVRIDLIRLIGSVEHDLH